ncbi:MAG: RDD family protein [Bdellovibrionota bacterium]|nr:MAG: RDD family protein [Bdellovibrionota bacterium]
MSELRDLCPECLTDLRPAKRKIGLTVTSPDSTYEELLGKTIKKPLTNPVVKAVEGLFGTLSSLIGAPPSPIARRSIELERLTQQPPIPEVPEPPTTISQSAPAAPSPPIVEETTAVPQTDLLEAAEEVLPGPPEPVPESRESALALTSTAVEATPRIGMDFTSYPPSTATAQIAVAGVPASDSESTGEIFSAAMREFLEHPNGTCAELTLSAFQPLPKTEEVELLFELSDESFLNPAVDDRYSEQIVRGETPTLPSDFLREELEKAERALNPSTLSLRELQRLRAAREKQAQLAPHERQTMKANPVPLSSHLAAWMLDMLVALFVAALSSSLLVESVHPGWWNGAINLDWDQVHALSFVTVLAPSFLVFILLYPLISVLTSGTTIGRERFGIAFRSSRGSRSSRGQIALRDLSFPLLFLLGGWISMLRRRAQPSDVLTDCFPVLLEQSPQ